MARQVSERDRASDEDRSDQRRDRGDPRARRRHRQLQYERGRHRRIHAPALGNDRQRRIERASARMGHVRAQYAKYVVADKVISLRDFIDRSSTETARWFGLKVRGELKPGDFADDVVFAPQTSAAPATSA